MTALVMIITPVVIGSLLPSKVVAELELDSINPPPDTVEEEHNTTETFLSPISLRRADSS
jgi:hypothetical protein